MPLAQLADPWQKMPLGGTEVRLLHIFKIIFEVTSRKKLHRGEIKTV